MKLYHVMHNAVCASCSKTPNKRHAAFLPRVTTIVWYMLPTCLSVCPSVCLSQAGILSKQLDEMRWFLTWRLPFSYHPLDSSKIKGFLCGTLSQTLDLENSATTGRSCCQQNSSTVELVYHTSDGQRVEAAYYTSEML